MGKYIKGAIDEDLGLGTLASKTAVEASFDETVNERTRVSSIVATWDMNNFTPGAGIGPILVGVAQNDYTQAEIEEFLETTGSWNEGDLVAQEVAGRKIRRIGVFEIPDDAGDAVTLNDGKPIKTKLNWIMLQGQTLNLWAYNLGSNPIATTAPNVHASGHANLWPQ